MNDKDDSIAALLALPSSEWSIESTREALFAALYRLKLANELHQEQERLISEQKALSESLKVLNEKLALNIKVLTELLTVATSGKEPTKTATTDEKRRPGRPKKEAKHDLEWVCVWYEQAIERFEKCESDRELIEAWFSAEGLNKRQLAAIAPKIETFRKEYLTPAKGLLEPKWKAQGKSMSRKAHISRQKKGI